MHNPPDPFQVSLVRNDGSSFPKIADAPLTGKAMHANHLAFKAGGPEILTEIISSDKGDAFVAQDLQTGKPADLGALNDLPKGSDYAVGHFSNKTPAYDLLLYTPGDPKLKALTGLVFQKGSGFQTAKSSTFNLSDPILRIIPIHQG